ncbi:hypothetical protein [Methylomonas albis]|nr:hypothetical protein [Methylomonas albis]
MIWFSGCCLVHLVLLDPNQEYGNQETFSGELMLSPKSHKSRGVIL